MARDNECEKPWEITPLTSLSKSEKRTDKMKVMLGVMLLACVPMAVAESHYSYPTEKLAEFVVEKLEVASIPSPIRPKLARGKTTLGDYGYTTQKVDENEALVKAPEGSSQMAISILEENSSGIYVCVNGQGQNQNSGHIQRVLLLKLNNANGLLKGREASKEFDSCPVIAGASADGGD
jgi:hypothetical protein